MYSVSSTAPDVFTHRDGSVYHLQRTGNMRISGPDRYLVRSEALGSCSGLPFYGWNEEEAIDNARAHYAKRLLERAAQTN